MLLAGPSKAGKSFALIELCISIAEGVPWLGRFGCSQGKILYVNMEIDRASFLARMQAVYEALELQPHNLQNIVVWNLRGVPLRFQQFVPAVVRRAKRDGCTAIIIDPIYKLGTGDENSARAITQFCNGIDLIAEQTGCSVIYCHHHSKGAQGGKRSMDRASGSGVFARDPDAILDVIELELPQSGAAPTCPHGASRGRCVSSPGLPMWMYGSIIQFMCLSTSTRRTRSPLTLPHPMKKV